jgi:hypothetical protein
MTDRIELSNDQEDMANDALGALIGLYDLMTDLEYGATVKAESVTHLLKLCIVQAQRAIPDGAPKHPRAVNDLDTG